MDIYVVQPNDTLTSIANKFGVSTNNLIRDNELDSPKKLVPGQTIVIVYPEKTYVVKEGDTLKSIAEANNISQMQLLRNNPFLSNTELFPGEELTISYKTTGKISTSGFIYPYIDKNVLKKTLPALTYVSIYNYRVINEGKIISYTDDSEVVQISKDYGTIPLMMATTLSAQGEPDIETAYSILLNDAFQETFITDMLNIIKANGYLGINLIFNYINPNSLYLYQNLVSKIIKRFGPESYLVFVTINPNAKYVDNELVFDKIDYSGMSQLVPGVTFLQFIWGTNYEPPAPVNSIEKMRNFIAYVVTLVEPIKISVGISLISYDWKLPYIPGISYANSSSLNSSLRLARDVGSTIQFDDVSQSPYFTYELINYGQSELHIVWSVDARTISAFVELITEYKLNGVGLWNLMIYFAQLWLVINTQFEIEKLIPDQL